MFSQTHYKKKSQVCQQLSTPSLQLELEAETLEYCEEGFLYLFFFYVLHT